MTERWLFFDTSVLVKYVHEEEGSEREEALSDRPVRNVP